MANAKWVSLGHGHPLQPMYVDILWLYRQEISLFSSSQGNCLQSTKILHIFVLD